jgi:hypothetical protein
MHAEYLDRVAMAEAIFEPKAQCPAESDLLPLRLEGLLRLGITRWTLAREAQNWEEEEDPAAGTESKGESMKS